MGEESPKALERSRRVGSFFQPGVRRIGGRLFLRAGLFGGVVSLLLILPTERSRVEAVSPNLKETQSHGTAKHSIRFRDVVSLSRFDYKSNNNFVSRKYFPQPMCGGVAIFDYDNDGRQDIFLTNGAKLPELEKTDPSFYNCLLRNRGGGKFEDLTLAAGLDGKDLGFSFGVVAGDYDNDGHRDLFVCNAGRNALYRNGGNGKFTDVTKEAGLDDKQADLLSVAAAWLDYDNDGLLDLVVSQYTFWNPDTDKPCRMPDGTEFYCNPQSVVSVPHTLYRNLGNGKFADVSKESGFSSYTGKGMGVGVADFNADGFVDVFVAHDTEPNGLYLNRGDGTFEEVSLLYGVAYNAEALRVSGMGCDAKDFNNDGWPDIFYNNLQNQIHALFQNQGGDYFDYVSPGSRIAGMSRSFSGWSNGFIDFDNDGWKDIFSANGDVDYLGPNAIQHDTMWRNVEGEHFVDVSDDLGEDFLHLGFQRGSAFGDLNNDGFLDIVVTSLNEKPRILLNSGSNGNHWLLLELTGRSANRDAVGALAKVTLASGRALYNHVTTSVGFMSSPDTRLHFGLGKEKKIKSVEIRWPGGETQFLTNVRADRIVKVVQGR